MPLQIVRRRFWGDGGMEVEGDCGTTCYLLVELLP
jgi:hypothetical protein